MRQLIVVFLIALLVSIVCASRAFWTQTHTDRASDSGPWFQDEGRPYALPTAS